MEVVTYRSVSQAIEQKTQQHFERIIGKGWADIEPDAKQGGTWAYCEGGWISLIVVGAWDDYLNIHYKEIKPHDLFQLTRLNLSTFDVQLGEAFYKILTILSEELEDLQSDLSMINLDKSICKFLEELRGFNGKPMVSEKIRLSDNLVFERASAFIKDNTAVLVEQLEFKEILKKLIN